MSYRPAQKRDELAPPHAISSVRRYAIRLSNVARTGEAIARVIDPALRGLPREQSKTTEYLTPDKDTAGDGQSVPRPNSCSAANYMRGVHHSMTSSAAASSDCGTVRPSMRAVPERAQSPPTCRSYNRASWS
jgi:hypothetical protein